MGPSTLAISFRIDEEKGGFKSLVVDAESFKKVISEGAKAARGLGSEMAKYSSMTMVFGAVKDSISAMNAAVQELSAAYAVQQQAETQLSTVMRERMDATEEDIKSILDLCTAQQQLGVIGDEIQIAGAQQLATFISQRDTLQSLIPVMNNYVAQHAGLKATANDTTSAATMLGKAMSGNANVLKRAGITLTAAQAEILKMGTESEKAAVLVEVFSAKCGNMNEALANTSSGRLKQYANDFGDLKENIGEVASRIAPVISQFANLTIAAAGIMKLGTAIKGAVVAIASFQVKGRIAALIMRMYGETAAATALKMNGYSTAAFKSAIVTEKTAKAMRLAAIATKSAMAISGLGLAVMAVTSIYSLFADKVDKSSDSLTKMTAAQRAAVQAEKDLAEAERVGVEASAAAKIQIDEHIKKIEEFKGSKAQEQKLLDELRSTYGSVMGDFETLSGWYQALIKNSEDYCRQMVIEAKTRKYIDQIVEKEGAFEQKWGKYGHTYVQNQTAQTYKGQGAKYRAEGDLGSSGITDGISTNELAKKQSLRRKADIWDSISAEAGVIDDLYKKLSETRDEASKIEFSVKGTEESTPSGSATPSGHASQTAQAEKTRLQEINSLIDEKKQLFLNASESEQKSLQEEISSLNKEKQAIETLLAAAERPVKFESLKDFDAELNYQNRLLQSADKTQMAGIQKTIDNLSKAREEFAAASHSDVAVDEIGSYKQLNDELQFYNNKLQSATADERTQIQKRIVELQRLKEKWDEVLADVDKPLPVDKLKSAADIQKAIQYYENRQQKSESPDERMENQRTINTLQKKQQAGQRGEYLLEVEDMFTSLDALTGKDYAIKLQGIGFDAILEMIEAIQKMLRDTENPLSDLQANIAGGLLDKLNEVKDNKAFGTLTKDEKTAWEGVNQLSSAFSNLGSSIGVPAIDILGTIGQAIATMVLSYSTAMSQATALGPWNWIAFAAAGLAQLTAVIASVKNVAKFADGGIAYGPTLGLFGEYAGASSNPEVVAPLNKLRSLIEPREAAVVAGHVVFDIEGRKLRGVLKNVNTLSSRS